MTPRSSTQQWWRRGRDLARARFGSMDTLFDQPAFCSNWNAPFPPSLESPHSNHQFSPLAHTAIQASILSRETIGDWIRFRIQISHVFKHTSGRLKKPIDFLWVPIDDIACKCPKLKIKHSYLVLGMSELRKPQVSCY